MSPPIICDANDSLETNKKQQRINVLIGLLDVKLRQMFALKNHLLCSKLKIEML